MKSYTDYTDPIKDLNVIAENVHHLLNVYF